MKAIALTAVILLASGCATQPREEIVASGVGHGVGLNHCEYVAAKGSHIKEIRCARPDKSQHMRDLSGSGGNPRLACYGDPMICNRILKGD